MLTPPFMFLCAPAGLYEKRVMDAYSSGDAQGLPPHVYAIASAAYKKMRSEGKGQAILVSREGWL